MSDDAGDGDRTSAWIAQALAHAYRLTSQDQEALQELRAGTAMLIGIGGHRRGDNTYELADLGSMNGTYVNDQLVQVAALADGDRIRFGSNLFLFVRGSR